jgi:hypothetical protein
VKPHSEHSTFPSTGLTAVAQTGQCFQPSRSATDRNNRAMQEDPEATPEEQEQATERLPEAQEAAAPGHEDDDLPGDKPPDEPIHES